MFLRGPLQAFIVVESQQLLVEGHHLRLNAAPMNVVKPRSEYALRQKLLNCYFVLKESPVKVKSKLGELQLLQVLVVKGLLVRKAVVSIPALYQAACSANERQVFTFLSVIKRHGVKSTLTDFTLVQRKIPLCPLQCP